jgi:hypothetical protein
MAFVNTRYEKQAAKRRGATKFIITRPQSTAVADFMPAKT